MAGDDERFSDMDRRRAEVSTWFTDGPGGIAIVVVGILAAILLLLYLFGVS